MHKMRISSIKATGHRDEQDPDVKAKALRPFADPAAVPLWPQIYHMTEHKHRGGGANYTPGQPTDWLLIIHGGHLVGWATQGIKMGVFIDQGSSGPRGGVSNMSNGARVPT